MTNSVGAFSLKDLAVSIQNGSVETVILAFTDHYGRLVGKRLDADYYLKVAADKGVEACNYLLTVDMDMDPKPGYQFAKWDSGYGDFHCQPDASAVFLASWLDKTALILCDVNDNKTHQLVDVAPRNILKRQLQSLESEGYSSMMASELEYYLFQDSYREAHEKNYTKLETMGWYREDYHILQGTREEGFNAAARRHLKLSGIPVETSKGEWGVGQNELNIVYADPLTMADRHIVYKQCLKELADQMGVSVTFMAKYQTDEAGSSCHLHVSLYKDGKNCFVGNSDEPNSFSDIFHWFLGGWMRYMPETMVLYSPTINAYKRYQVASWAPTRLAWSLDNRTVGFRIVGEGQNLRIECRIPGADVNPYLAFAAVIASGLEGINEKISAPPMYEGDAYTADGLPEVPKSLHAAAHAFKHSEFVKKAFGEQMQKHYSHFFELECQAYDAAVTDWERQRYFEQI